MQKQNANMTKSLLLAKQKKKKPALKSINALPKNRGTVDTLLADAGYFSKDNVELCEKEKIQPYISTNRNKQT
jgi:NADP-dependent 3-hydroxy acid dehydrogenase YdfG